MTKEDDDGYGDANEAPDDDDDDDFHDDALRPPGPRGNRKRRSLT